MITLGIKLSAALANPVLAAASFANSIYWRISIAFQALQVVAVLAILNRQFTRVAMATN
jgi:hypothetical protein